MRRLTGVIAACGLVASLVAAPSALAGAGDDARIVVVTKPINSGVMDGAAVQCAPGERAIGGGTYQGTSLAASGPIDSSGYVQSTLDGDIPVYWFTAVYNATGSSREFRFYAICSASSDATVRRAAFHLDSPPNFANPTRGDAAAECPSGQRAIGGGVGYAQNTVANGTRLDASGPLDETGVTQFTHTGDTARYWYGAVSDYDPALADGQYYAVFAICSATSQATLQTTVIGINDNISHSLVCPAGSRATGGGAVPVDDITTVIISSTPTDALGAPFNLGNGDIPRGWEAYGDNETIANDPFTHSVVCDPATPAVAPPGATGQRAAALAKCKKKRSKKARKRCKRRARLLPARQAVAAETA